MLKMHAGGTKDGKPLHIIIFGLSYKNLKGLKEGKPIIFPGDAMDLPGTEFLIFAGKDERSMQEEFKHLIGPDTKVTVDPRLDDQAEEDKRFGQPHYGHDDNEPS